LGSNVAVCENRADIVLPVEARVPGRDEAVKARERRTKIQKTTSVDIPIRDLRSMHIPPA
jgi:hypothetical protein